MFNSIQKYIINTVGGAALAFLSANPVFADQLETQECIDELAHSTSSLANAYSTELSSVSRSDLSSLEKLFQKICT